MRKISLIFVLVIAMASVFSQEKPKPFKEDYELTYGELWEPILTTKKGFTVNGLIEGECRYYTKGKKPVLVAIENYHHGKVEGQHIQYYPNGKVFAVGIVASKDSLSSVTSFDSTGSFISTRYYYHNTKEAVLSILFDFYRKDLGFQFNDSIYYKFDTITNKFVEDK